MERNDGRWSRNTLLGSLDAYVRQEVLAAGVVNRYPEERYLLRQDERGDHVLVLLSGTAKVLVHTSSGHLGLLGIRIAGEMIGEMSALDERVPRSASVITGSVVTVAKIGRRRLEALMTQHPQLSLAVTRMISERLRWANRRRIDAGTYGPRVRVARLIAELAACYGNQRPDGWDLGLNLTQAELGSLAGIAQRTAERELRMLEDENVIKRRYRRLEIVDSVRLRSIAEWDQNPPLCVFS
ncbi:Crp/Fnr family transcriptional regulator [Amycolatopsis sp. NPDC059657]|uniref:Crp/Fnr family transcriptional regulator n=1 Tax=Amycolatopsis sp. NPDC059657 TaxID=3346899 RepID=UPI003671F276